MASVLAAALGRSGAEVTTVKVAPGASRAAAVRSLLSTLAEKAVLVSLHEWKSDTYTNSELVYDVEMEVFNRRGDVLAKKRAEGTDQLGGSFWNPPAHAREAIPPAFQRKMEDLYFGDIARALNEPESHAAAPGQDN